jgi:hypothetical protein
MSITMREYRIRLLETTEVAPRKRVRTAGRTGLATDPDTPVACAACGHPVTHRNARLAVNGTYEHSFMNPHGFSFHIACFKTAPGCKQSGIPTHEHSWFKGYSWRYALCSQCHEHLGWHYIGNGDDFYGLIKSRLIENPRLQQ